MHILLISHYYEPDSGAAAVRLSRLMKLLHQRGHQITVLTTMPHYPQGKIQDPYRGQFMSDEDRDGIRVIQMWLWASPKKSIIFRLISQLSFMLTCALRGIFLPRPDVIFIENQPIFTGLAGWFISKIKRRPYLLNVSDFWPEYLLAVGVLTEGNILYKIFKSLVNRTQKDADAIVTLLEGLWESVQARIGVSDKGHVIMNAVDLERFNPDAETVTFREKYQLGTQKIISFVGTMGNHIDLEMMLDVAEHFKARDDVRFVFFGTGINRDILDNRKDLSNVQWTGWVEHREMPYAWASSYVTFWAVHNHELNRLSFQSKLYEALASGVPPIVSVEGIIAEVLKKDNLGIPVPFGAKYELIEVLEHILDNPDLRDDMSQNARQYALENFNPDDVADRYEAVLKDSVKN
ncbi:MAG: glycosyltransferase family 4 protein [Phototrophicaceae bacterium]